MLEWLRYILVVELARYPRQRSHCSSSEL